MKFLKHILVLAVFALTLPSLMAEDNVSGSSGGEFKKVGAAGAQFLKIGVGARANGMAGAYSALANDVTAMYWNPAGIADINGIAANISYTQWFAGFSHNFAGLVLPVGDSYRFGISLTSFSSGEIPITTLEKAEGTGASYSISDFALGASFAGYITNEFAFGMTFKYIQNSFASLGANGVAFDVGTVYKTDFKDTRLSFSISNLGGKQAYAGADLNRQGKLINELSASPLDQQLLTNPFNLPLIFRAGASTDVTAIIQGVDKLDADADHRLIAAMEFETLSDTPEMFTIGAEYTWNNILSIRGGYKLGHDSFTFAGGVGFKYVGEGFDGQIDYSVNPVQNIGLVNRLSIGMRLE
ncbi:MAG: PorV/PorQ family protein [Candidatus Kapaibacteriota bacterium]